MSRGTETMERLGAESADGSTPGLLLLCAKDAHIIPRAVPIRSDSLALGREPPRGGCCIPQTAVSRLHARIVRRDDGWELEDLDSRNGTYVDGHRVDRVTLPEGALVRIGDTLFKFVARDFDAYLPYATGAAARDDGVPELVGGLQMNRLARQLETAATTDLSVLILGETGTGKELAARALHRLSGRAGPLVPINCAAVPTHLFESELFGYRKSAFTGADRDKPGILQAAQGGTVHLDEIGDMPLEVQAKLLRVLESREVRSVGALRPEPVDVRFVCATHQDLPALVAAGRFRADLFARISAMTLALPPLRTRKEDLPALVGYFLDAAGRPDLDVSFGFMLAICDYDWPLNVRECAAAIRRAVAVADGPTLRVAHLPPALEKRIASYGSRTHGDEPPPASERGLPDAGRLRELLTEHGGNIAAVARALGRDRAQIHRLIRRHDLVPDDYRARRG